MSQNRSPKAFPLVESGHACTQRSSGMAAALSARPWLLATGEATPLEISWEACEPLAGEGDPNCEAGRSRPSFSTCARSGTCHDVNLPAECVTTAWLRAAVSLRKPCQTRCASYSVVYSQQLYYTETSLLTHLRAGVLPLCQPAHQYQIKYAESSDW